MSYAYPKSFVPKTDVKTGSPSKAIEDSKKKTNLLKDNSWIKKKVEEDEPVDDDPNFGRVVLSRLKSNEYPDEKSSDNDTSNTGSSGTPKSSSTSVQSITKKFSGTQEVKSSAPPSYDKAIASKSVNTKVSADGKTTETTETTITTSRTAATKQTFSERVFSDVKSPSKPKPSVLPPKPPKPSADTDAASRKGTLSVSSPKASESTTVTTFTETVKNDRTYSSSSPTSSTTTTTRTRSASSPKPSETTTMPIFTEPAKDKPLDALAEDLISLPSSSAYSSQDRDYSRTYSSSSPNSSTTTTTRTRSVSSPRPSETTTVTSYTDPAKDKPLDVLSDDLISKPSSSAYSSQDRDYSRTYSSSSPNSSTITTTRTSSVSSPRPSETTTVTSYTDPAKDNSAYSSQDRDYSRTYSSSSPNSSTITTTRTRSVSSPRPTETTTVTSYTETVKDREYRTYSPSPDSITRNIRTYSSSEYSPSVRTNSYSTLNSEPSYTDGLYKSRSYTSLPRETSYEYSSLSSPSSYTKTSYLESSPSGSYSDLVSMKSNSSVYASPDRAITAKDICTYCNKPMSIDPKMILDDLQIHCHATCFKCEVCSTSLGHLKAGDTMWIYRRTVHCERCFETTRDKWRR
ncbi:sciellin isoform X1 [Anguilla anguilla]|uniref:sciellin isoform X1 n=1 Tax=Anguilla anguilla TaxID=7936 RepID=UPI0015B07D85|nr:sciellin isoform X1 [Anguilla anguilla]